MKNCGRIAGGPIWAALLAFGLPAQAQLLDDPLQGSTIGTRAGGTFVAGGWRVDNEYDSIFWHVTWVPKGAFQYDVKGLPPGQNCPGSGFNSKNELSHMYDYTYNNADFSYAPGYRDDPFKQFIRKQCDPGKTDTLELVWGTCPGGTVLEEDSPALSWDVNTTYTWRDEWDLTGANSILKTYRNGVLVWTQTVPGVCTPGGFSVRIAASTRRGDEGAAVGSVYSNVKVFDLGCTTPPAPTISSPATNEIFNPPMAFVQWSGSGDMYQVRINTANNPNAGTVWDTQSVTSSRTFSWTGTLPNGSYFAFVRVGKCGTLWGPWSTGRPFSVNTSYVPPGANVVKVKGNSLCDNNGPFLGLGFSHFRALQRCKFDRNRYQSDLAFMHSKGFRYQRALSMVAWDGVEIAPVSFTGPTHAVAAWSDYDQQLKDAIDIAYDTYQIRTELTIFADAEWVMPNDSTRMAHLDRVLADLVGREHKIVHLEVANEYWQNGFPDPAGVADVRSKGLYLANKTSIPIAFSSPSDTSDAGIVNMYAGGAADLATVHFSRDLSTAEDGWQPVRDCFRTGVAAVPPMTSNEPIGPGSSVNTENDPLRLGMAGIFAWTANLPAYVFHCKAGVQGWTNCCPVSGTEVFFNTTPGTDAYLSALALLPPDLPSWERSDGKDVNSPFTNYSGGQANKWWPEVSGANTGCIRNIAAFKGADFVSCPIGIQSGGVDIEARRSMALTIYNALTGGVVATLAKNAHEHFTLTPSPAPAYIIKGTFTDVTGLCNSASDDLGNPDVESGLTNTQNSDGDTTPATIGGRTCKRNVNQAEDFYFYFNVSDSFALNGSSPDMYITINYFDSGTSSLSLNYDSIGSNFADYYKNGGSVALTNTNTWKSYTWHVTDAYFGNRENAGADFRIGDIGPVFYLDVVSVSAQPLLPPIIHPPTPNPETGSIGVPYAKQLTLDQGQCPAPVWSVLQGPVGLTVNAAGQVSGWTPTAAQLGDNLIQIQAANSAGSSSVSWIVRILSQADFDGDGDVDALDFALMQRCFSGNAFPYAPGCSAPDLDQDGDVDSFDFALFVPCMRGAGQTPGC